MLICGLVMFGADVFAQANLAPRALADAEPAEIIAGQTIAFTGSDSFDPDEGPGELTYAWDFGDGEESSDPDPIHRYALAGVYDITLRVADGATHSLATLRAHVLAPPTPRAPIASSMLYLDEARRRLWVTNSDSGSVSVVDTVSAERVTEIVTGGRPTSATSLGDLVIVVDRDGGRLLALDSVRFTVDAQLDVGPGPAAIVCASTRGECYITLEDASALVVVDADLSQVLRRVELSPSPRALALSHDEETLYISHFRSTEQAGRLTQLSLPSGMPETVEVAYDEGPDSATSGRGVPNLLGAIAIEPSGERLWVGGLKSNTRRGLFVSGEPNSFTNRLRALFAPFAIDASGHVDDLYSERIDVNDADAVSAIAFGPRGRWAYLTHPGSGRMSIYDLSANAGYVRDGAGGSVPFVRVDVGEKPAALAVSSTGTRVYVLSELSRQVHFIDVFNPNEPRVRSTVEVTDEPLAPNVALGKRLFHRSRGPFHSLDNYIACASCHPDGSHDGQTWDFTAFGEGLRNTIDLRGRGGSDHGPIHWSGNFDEVQDFENDIVHGFGGEGLLPAGESPNPPLGETNAGRSEQLDALADYVASLQTPPPSPHRGADGFLTEEARAGRALFNAAGCPECHVRPRYTDSAWLPERTFHDVGTLRDGSGQRLGEPLLGLDTPTLLGLWDGAPYLHDGRATLLEVLTVDNAMELHGRTRHLSAADLVALRSYLMQIDARPENPPPTEDGGMGSDAGIDAGVSHGGGACAVATAPSSIPIAAVAACLFALLQRRKP